MLYSCGMLWHVAAVWAIGQNHSKPFRPRKFTRSFQCRACQMHDHYRTSLSMKVAQSKGTVVLKPCHFIPMYSNHVIPLSSDVLSILSQGTFCPTSLMNLLNPQNNQWAAPEVRTSMNRCLRTMTESIGIKSNAKRCKWFNVAWSDENDPIDIRRSWIMHLCFRCRVAYSRFC